MDDSPKSPDDLAVPLTEKDHVLGSDEATITLLEYGDYECPDCLNAQPVVAELRARLGDRLRIAFRHFPLSSVHPHASMAAAAAEAAGAQGRFWEMHEQLFRHQRELADIDLTHLALRLGLEIYRFQSDVDSQSTTRRVRADYEGGVRSGVTGTPTFFINGVRYRGKADAAAIAAAIERP